MGFKSKVTPCLDVVRLDGQRCLGYVEKELSDIRMSKRIKPRKKLIFLHNKNGVLFCVE